MVFKDNEKETTIELLKSLKVDINTLNKSNAIAFAAKTIDLIIKSVGENSEQYRLMQNLLFDQTILNLNRTIQSTDSLIVDRVKGSNTYTSLIDNCINFVIQYGIYKHPYEKKNILGDFNNSEIWTLAGFFFLVSFSMGVVATKFGLTKIFDPNEIRDNAQIKSQKETPKDTLLPVPQKKNQKPLK